MAMHSKVSTQFRSLKLMLLLFTFTGVQSLAQAETLYQWKEADGSLTFAPNPPPEGSGIDYKVVEPSASVNPVALVDELPTAKELASASRSSNSQQTALSSQNSSLQPQSSVEYTPLRDTQNLRNPLPPGISAVSYTHLTLPTTPYV